MSYPSTIPSRARFRHLGVCVGVVATTLFLQCSSNDVAAGGDGTGDPTGTDAAGDASASDAARPADDGAVVEEGFALRIDCGATTSTTDSKGHLWEADRGFSANSVAVDRSAVPVDGTDDAFVYRTERSKISGYSLEVPNGTYLVRLYFAETEFDAASLRQMSLTVETQTLPTFDPFVAAGGKQHANVQEFRHVAVQDGKLDVTFASATNNAKIDGIEILADAPDAAPTALTLYPGPNGISPSADYAVTVNGNPLFVYQARASVETNYQPPPHVNSYETMGFGYFDFSGEVRVEITPKRSFSTVSVRPSWKGVTPRVENGKIVLILREPRNISVELDGSWHQPLFLFANPPDTNVPSSSDPNVLWYGPGVHDVGYVSIGSNKTVYLAGGAIVRGTLAAANQSNVTVRGRGILDGSTAAVHSTFQMRFENVAKLDVEGIILQDSPSWTMPMYQVTNATIRNIKMLGYRQNSDCLDIVSGANFVVENSFLRCFDDGVTLKAYNAADSSTTSVGTTNIQVRHNTIWTDWGYGALDIGAELRTNKISNIRFEDNDVLHPLSAAISINNSEQALVTDVAFNDTRVEGVRSGELVRFWVGQDTYSQNGRGSIDGVKVQGFRLLNGPANKLAVEIQGFDTTHRVANVAFSDMWLLGAHVTSAASLSGLSMNAYVSNISFAP